MSRVYQNLGLPAEATSLTVSARQSGACIPTRSQFAVRSWRDARKRYYRELLQAHAAAKAAAEIPQPAEAA